MKQQIEKEAQEYADRFIGSTERKCRRSAFMDGANFALSHQWVSVDERLPEPHEEVLTYTVNAIDENAVAYYDGEDWYNTYGEHIRPHYWLPIPQLIPEKE